MKVGRETDIHRSVNSAVDGAINAVPLSSASLPPTSLSAWTSNSLSTGPASQTLEAMKWCNDRSHQVQAAPPLAERSCGRQNRPTLTRNRAHLSPSLVTQSIQE